MRQDRLPEPPGFTVFLQSFYTYALAMFIPDRRLPQIYLLPCRRTMDCAPAAHRVTCREIERRPPVCEAPPLQANSARM
jgi:hypothetical protein